MEKGVGDEKDDNNENKEEEKKAEYPDVTPPDDMDKGLGDKKIEKTTELTRKKKQNAQMSLLLMIWRKV